MDEFCEIINASSEVCVNFGRVDAVTDEYVIEVDRLKKYHEAIGQSLHYSFEMNKKPAIALMIDDKLRVDLIEYIDTLCIFLNIKVYILVTKDDFVKLVDIKLKQGLNLRWDCEWLSDESIKNSTIEY